MNSFILTEDVLSAIQATTVHSLQNSRGSHDLEHTMRVYRLCLHIGKTESANLDIIKLAALLHDIGRHEQDKSQGTICHAEVGAKLAGSILQKHEIPKEIIAQVEHCIKTHRFRRNDKPLTIEAKVLYDADKLDGIGAVGIGRAFLFAGEIGAKLHNSDIEILETDAYTKEDTAYREYMVKLRHIKDKMLTTEGMRLALARHNFMVEFFSRLIHECSGVC